MRCIARRRGARILDVFGRFDNAARCRSCRRAPARNCGTACYAPVLREADREDLRHAEPEVAYSLAAHRVAGHLMRIGHLGKAASAEARAAYRDDHQRAGLAGPHELPRGFTYVREHERGF